MSRLIRSILSLAVALLLPGPGASAAEIDNDGGVTLTLSFEHNPDLPNGVPVPVHEPGAETHYCNTMKEFSEALFLTTEGRHWIKRVRFFEEFDESQEDITWNYLVDDSGDDSFGTYQKRIRCASAAHGLRTTQRPRRQPRRWACSWTTSSGTSSTACPTSTSTSRTTAVVARGSARTATTSSGTSVTGSRVPACFATRSKRNATPGVPCVFYRQCIAGPFPVGTPCRHDAESRCDSDSDNAGEICALDDDCQGGDCQPGCGQGGICLGGNPDRDDKHEDSTVRICRPRQTSQREPAA